MTPSQPLPAITAAANPIPPTGDDVSRLIRLWANLAQRVVSADAHNDGDHASLRQLQLQVEDALAARLVDSQLLLDELVAWEASIIHVADDVPPESCLTCRRARLGLPRDLPFPAGAGGPR